MTEPQPPGQPLLHAKLLAPRLYAALIPRARLQERLDDGLRRKLILVTAPTGFGKTTLVSQWLEARKLPFAWVTLDENDNDPVRFWSYVITGIRTLDKTVGKTALEMLAAAPPNAKQPILTSLINDLAQIGGPGVLVLEDYQAIRSPQILSQVRFMLQYLPELLHLVLITRSEPDLPLGILRARDELLEITAADLRFSLEETEHFLRQTLEMEISPTALAGLQEQTAGWPAGLRLASLSLQNKHSPAEVEFFIQAFSGGHHYITDYLAREVLADQAETRQQFLLKTSFLERLTGSLCDAVTGTSTGEFELEQLERESLFIVRLENSRGRVWYRYTPIFAELIRALAHQRLGEAGETAVYQKASGWYEYHQQFSEAIEASLAANDYAYAIELVNIYVKRNSVSEMYTLKRWLERLPDTLTLTYPEICLAYAQVILFWEDRFSLGTAARMEPYLRAAEETWRAEGDEGRVGEVLALRGMMLLWQGDYQHAFPFVYQSLELLPEHDVQWRAMSLLNAATGELMAGQIVSAQDKILEGRALSGAAQNIYGMLAAAQMLGDVFYWQGDHDQSVLIFRQIIQEAVGDVSMLDDQGIAHLGLADIAYELNDLAEAEEQARQALELAKKRANENLESQAVSRLALIDAAGGNFSQAQERIKAFISGLKNTTILREIQCVQAQIAIMTGDAASLEWWQSGIAMESPNLTPMRKEREAFTLARLRLAQGRFEEARRLLYPWKAEAESLGRLRSLVEAGCIEALAERAGGDLMQAARTLAAVLEIGQKKRFCRLILDHGAPMAVLLREVSPLLTNRVLSLYSTTLLHAFGEGTSLQPPGEILTLVEPLSQQELRVLRLLVAGLPNADVARELVVSLNTVKTHVKNIYRKLDINSREEARQVAKELKLV